MNEGVDFHNTMASIKNMLAANQQQYLVKISKSASYSTTQMLQANFKLRAANDAAINQIMNECTRLGLQSLATSLEQFRQNAEIMINSLITILQIRGSTKEKNPLNPLSNLQTANKENADYGIVLNKNPASTWILPPSQSNSFIGKTDLTKYNEKQQSGQLIRPNQVIVESPQSDGTQPNLLGFSKNSGQNSHERAKKLYEDIERGKITWNWTSKIRDPFVLIELSQMISADLIKNIEKSKIDLSKVSDFGPAQTLRSNPSPIALLESIQTSIHEFYNRIYKMDKPLNEEELEQQQRQLEEALLSNIDERMREFWKHVIHSCMENYKLMWENRLRHSVSVQTGGEDLDLQAEIEAASNKHLSRLINLEVDHKKTVSTLNRLKDKYSKLKAEFKEKDETLKAVISELSEARVALATQRISSEENTSRSKYYNQRIEELQKKVDENLLKEKLLIADMSNLQSIFNETLKFLQALKERLSSDLAAQRRNSVANASYVLSVMEFLKKWDHIDFDGAIETFLKYQKPSDQSKGNFIAQKLEMVSFTLKIRESGRDVSQNPPLNSLASKRRISKTINILSGQGIRSMQAQHESRAELPETGEQQNSKKGLKAQSETLQKYPIARPVLIFHNPSLNKSRLNLLSTKKEGSWTNQIKVQPGIQMSLNHHSSMGMQSDTNNHIQSNLNQQTATNMVSSQIVNVLRKQSTNQTGKEGQANYEINEEPSRKQMPKATTTIKEESNKVSAVQDDVSLNRNDEDETINFNENEKELLEMKSTDHLDKQVSINQVDFCYNYVYHKNIRSHTDPAIRRDKESTRDAKVTSVFPQINTRNQSTGLEMLSNVRQIKIHSKDAPHQTLDGGSKIKETRNNELHPNFINDLTEKMVSKNIATLMSRKGSSRFSSSKRNSLIDQQANPSSPHKTQQMYRPSNRANTDDQRNDTIDLRIGDSASPEKNLAAASKTPRAQFSRKQTDKLFVPYTVSTDYFNNHILKKRIKGIKGVSMGRRKSFRPNI